MGLAVGNCETSRAEPQNRETVLLEDGSLCNFRRPTNPQTVASRKVDKLWFALILSVPPGDSF
jgi:hypothetical protein